MNFLQKIIENKTAVTSKAKELRNLAVVFLLIDVSCSMMNEKLSQAKDGAIEFSRSAIKKGYRVGVISFDSEAQYTQSPVDDMGLLENSINGLMVGGSTNMHDALMMTDKNLREIRPKIAVVVIATDGMPNDEELALKQANKLKECKVSIITIGTDDADLEFLSKIASDKDLAGVVENTDLAKGISNASNKLRLPGIDK